MVVGSNPKADDFWNSFLQQDDFGTGVSPKRDLFAEDGSASLDAVLQRESEPSLRKYVLNMQSPELDHDHKILEACCGALIIQLDGDECSVT